MATKKTPLTDEDAVVMPGATDSDFDQAVDDLRGVLKADADGALGGTGTDFDAETASEFGDFGTDGGDMSSPFDTEAAPIGNFATGGGESFAAAAPQPLGSGLAANMDLIMDIPIDVQIVLGSSRMQVSGLMNLEEGAIIALDKKIGEPVEIMVNGRRIARGEITVLENDDTRFGVKLIEVMATKTS